MVLKFYWLKRTKQNAFPTLIIFITFYNVDIIVNKVQYAYSTSRYKINERSKTRTIYVKLIKTQRDHSAVQTKSINRRTKQGYWNTEALNVLTGLYVLAYSSLPEKSQCNNCAVGSNESNMQVTFYTIKCLFVPTVVPMDSAIQGIPLSRSFIFARRHPKRLLGRGIGLSQGLYLHKT